MEVEDFEYEYLVHSEKQFRLIALVHEEIQDAVGRPVFFHFMVEEDHVIFMALWRTDDGFANRLQMSLKIMDYRPDEIESYVRLAMAKSTKSLHYYL